MRSGDAAKVGTAALFGNDTGRGQRRKVDDTHVRHFFGEVEEGGVPSHIPKSYCSRKQDGFSPSVSGEF